MRRSLNLIDSHKKNESSFCHDRLGTSARKTEEDTPLFFEFSLCLSRVCLGKMIVYMYKWLKKGFFCTAVRAASPSIGFGAGVSTLTDFPSGGQLMKRHSAPPNPVGERHGPCLLRGIYVQTPLRFALGGRPVLSARFNVETAGSERKRPEI
jgi:hypothetical protein